jgi:hypothetical protein
MACDLASEAIPDSDALFRRIHRYFFDPDSGRISSGAFDGQEMSVDWSKYATPEETAAQDRTSNIVAVASLTAGACRKLGQDVVHDPIPETDKIPGNLAHALVCGRKSKPIKQKLRDAAVLVLQL